MKYLLILIALILPLSAQTYFRHNELRFTNGTGFTDTISENLPFDSISNQIAYTDYINYVYGYQVYDLGSVNVTGGTATTVLFGNWIGGLIEGDNVYTGLRGFSSAGRMGSSGGTPPNDQNTFSDLQIAKDIHSNSIWFRSDTNNKNQIDSYETVDITFTPYNQLALGLQGEGGNLNMQDLFYVDSTNERVGIGKTNPLYTLDVSGNIKANTLYGIIGKIATTSFIERVSLTLTNSHFVNVYRESFSTAGWPSDMDALAFVSFYSEMKSPPTSTESKNLMQFILIIYEKGITINDPSDILGQSGAAIFDADPESVSRDFTMFAGCHLQKDKEYYLHILGLSDGGRNGDGSLNPNVDIVNINGYVYALPSS